MSGAIETVGIYLTEDERRLLISLASDLECDAEFVRGSSAPEAAKYAATREALRKLMHLPAAPAGTDDELERLRGEVSALTTRRDELLALVVKVTRETPYPAELDECRSARSRLIAEVGTLRSSSVEQLARFRALLVDPAVSKEHHDDVIVAYQKYVANRDMQAAAFCIDTLPGLLAAARQLHTLLVALREICATGVTP
jgi:hypothetical protein